VCALHTRVLLAACAAVHQSLSRWLQQYHALETESADLRTAEQENHLQLKIVASAHAVVSRLACMGITRPSRRAAVIQQTAVILHSLLT
jgi:hypothetical protein